MLLSEYNKLNTEKRKKSRSRSYSKGKKDKSKDRKKKKEKEKKRLKWVLPGIIVRVISKKVDDGRLYNQKMRIIDVLDKYSFSAAPIDEKQSNLKNR